MKEKKIVEYKGNEYKITVAKDTMGLTVLNIFKKEKLFFKKLKSFWYFKFLGEGASPIEVAMKEIEKISNNNKD